MFDSAKTIILISNNKIQVARVKIGQTSQIENLVIYDWTKENLAEVLERVKKTYQTSIFRLALGEDVSYNVCLLPETEEEKKRENLKQKIEALVPENLDQTLWDFKEDTVILHKEDKKKTTVIQAGVVVKWFYDLLSEAVSKTKISFEAIEPISLSLARQTEARINPHLIISFGQNTTAIIAYKGIVFVSEQIDAVNILEKVKQLIDYTEKNYHLSPSEIIICGQKMDYLQKDLDSLKLKTENANLDPFIGIVRKADLKGRDNQILNLQLIISKRNEEKLQNDASKIDSPKKKLPIRTVILIIFAVIAVFGLFASIIFRSISSKIIQQSSSNQVTVYPTSFPTLETASEDEASPAVKADLSKHKLVILNGSGKGGEATKLGNILKEQGFQIGEIGNAGKYDYENTEVYYHHIVEKNFQNLLDKELDNIYTGFKVKISDEKYQNEVTIIIGKE